MVPCAPIEVPCESMTATLNSKSWLSQALEYPRIIHGKDTSQQRRLYVAETYRHSLEVAQVFTEKPASNRLWHLKPRARKGFLQRS